MIAQEALRSILKDACRAPSGDNAQPWRFEVRENTIHVINAPERDTSLFNWRQRTNHVALGACIENLCISAESRHFRNQVALFPDPQDHLLVAEILLTPDPSTKNDLAEYISKRSSNRKKYKMRKIQPDVLDQLTDLGRASGARVSFVTGDKDIRNLARIVSAGEKLALDDRSIHDFLFSHVTWTKVEDEKRHGFLIDTFEFSVLQKAAFRLFSNWNILKFFLPFGISNMIAKDMENVHATSAAFGAIVLPNDSDRDFVHAGMLLERLWLTATKLGLSLQGVTTVGYLGPRVIAGEASTLSPVHQQLLRERYKDLKHAFALTPPESFGFTFRLGYADPPSAMTTRFEPVIG